MFDDDTGWITTGDKVTISPVTSLLRRPFLSVLLTFIVSPTDQTKAGEREAKKERSHNKEVMILFSSLYMFRGIILGPYHSALTLKIQ